MRAVRNGAMVLAAVVLLAACGGGGDTYGEVDDVPDDAVVVEVANLAFEPDAIEVGAGDRVAWRFDDGVIPHNVTFAGEEVASENLRDGAVWARRFTTAGTYEYVCTLHPRMQATITVR